MPTTPGPDGCPLNLANLEQLALSNSPLLRQAAADVQAARGAARQAGAFPNPTLGYESDTVGTGNTAGYQGMYLEQTFVTNGKLKLAQAAATIDVRNAELALRRTESEVKTQVRTGYFTVLLAQENLRVARALARFVGEAYRLRVEQLRAGEAPVYEPVQLRLLASQMRTGWSQARARYLTAWKQLGAALCAPQMPPTELAGRIDMPVPLIDPEAALARVLRTHTDVLTAANNEQKARYNLRAAQVTSVPDVKLKLVVQKDFTVLPHNITHNIELGVPLPVFDRNQGNIQQAQGALARASDEMERLRNDLRARVAEALERYETNRTLLEEYRTHTLPDQMQVYMGTAERFRQEPDKVSFGDVLSAQQSLVAAVTSYVTALGTQWAAVVDLAGLLQVDDLSQVGDPQGVVPVPDLENLSLPRRQP